MSVFTGSNPAITQRTMSEQVGYISVTIDGLKNNIYRTVTGRLLCKVTVNVSVTFQDTYSYPNQYRSNGDILTVSVTLPDT